MGTRAGRAAWAEMTPPLYWIVEGAAGRMNA